MRIGHIMTGSAPSFKRRRHAAALMVFAATLMGLGTVGFGTGMPAEAAPLPAEPVAQASDRIVTGRLTAHFGESFDPFKTGTLRTHRGVDIAAPLGTPIYAPAAGTVQHATDNYQGKPAYGNVVVLLTDDGTLTLFSHLDSYAVTEGQRVSQGEMIAQVGSSGRSSGPHVHIETYRNEARVDPLGIWSLDRLTAN